MRSTSTTTRKHKSFTTPYGEAKFDDVERVKFVTQYALRKRKRRIEASKALELKAKRERTDERRRRNARERRELGIGEDTNEDGERDERCARDLIAEAKEVTTYASGVVVVVSAGCE